MRYKITEIATNKELTYEELALKLYKEGTHITYCDIEGIAQIDNIFYLLDECGQWCYIDTNRFVIQQI